jgi:hypothetical protein
MTRPVENSDPERATRRDRDILRSVLENSDPVGQQVAEVPAETTTTSTTWDIPGFHGKARISTSFGELPIEALRRRDEVRSISGGFLEVKWVDQIHLDETFLEYHPEAHPVLIRAGALGHSIPKADILMSPCQRLNTSGSTANVRMQYAADLTDRPNILVRPQTGITYYLFHFGIPARVRIEGLWCSVVP